MELCAGKISTFVSLKAHFFSLDESDKEAATHNTKSKESDSMFYPPVCVGPSPY